MDARADEEILLLQAQELALVRGIIRIHVQADLADLRQILAEIHAVGIRVADQDDVRLFTGAVFQSEFIGPRLFRVGSRRVGEVRIRRALLKHRLP